MSGLVEFLRARLDEDERRAQSGYYSDTHWEMFTTDAHLRAWRAWRQHFPREQWDVNANDVISDAARDAIRERITAHEENRTARMLADVEAKRRVLGAYEKWQRRADAGEDLSDFERGALAESYSVCRLFAEAEGWKP